MSQHDIKTMEDFREWIHEHMPWPFSDVDRDSQEAREHSAAIAGAAWPALVKEWTVPPDPSSEESE